MLLYLYFGYVFLSLCMGFFYLGRFSFEDPRIATWRDYMLMPLLLFIVASAATEIKEMKILVLLMCVSVFLLDKSFWSTIADRDFSTYSSDLRDPGAMGYAGVNGLAAFEAQATAFLIVLAGYEPKRLLRWGYFALAAFSAVCLMYSFSRGGYVAFLAGWLFIGLFKQRKLLLLLIVFGIMWTSLVPNAVVMRVEMTNDGGELDHSSETRLNLWEDAMEVFSSNPITGAGYETYAYMGRVGTYRDTHNIYLKVLVETGFIGLVLFLWLLGKTFLTGFGLFRYANDPFLASLGLGLSAWVVCSATANFFGDRWSFLQVNGYMWVIAGLVARGWALEHGGSEADRGRGVIEGTLEPSLQPA
jgi:O-antigen ligase